MRLNISPIIQCTKIQELIYNRLRLLLCLVLKDILHFPPAMAVEFLLASSFLISLKKWQLKKNKYKYFPEGPAYIKTKNYCRYCFEWFGIS